MPHTSAHDRRLPLFLAVLFCTALVVHFHFATRNWHYRFMAGHEFRQTQTALIAHYIDAENNFGPDYSVPILGKPWVLPLEFPLYEWAVVGLSRATHLPQFEAARAISLSCFYLTLPALFLLLGQLGLDRSRRLFVLACTLLCPVYIFYARAVLIDPMALMCSVWFLAAFTRMLRNRSWAWLPVVVFAGTAAGLIKSLVWFVWVLPAACYGVWHLWRDARHGGLRPALRTCIWGLGSALVPFAVALWWARYTDAIKAAHPAASIFTSANLARDNYGTFSLAAHVSPETWRNLFVCWQQSLLPPWAFALFIVPGIAFLPAWRKRIAGAASLFLIAQLTIPLAYALQDYYFYAANLFAVAAVAFVFLGLLDSRLPRPFAAALLLVPLIAFYATYRATYFPWAQVRSPGGSGLTESIKSYTPPGSVIIGAGNDWNAIIPYYTERKALMIRRGLETDESYLDRAFADLADEDVAALILCDDQRNNRALVERAAKTFYLDDHVTYTHPAGDVYMSRFNRELTIRRLHENHGYHDVTTQAQGSALVSLDIPATPLPPGSTRAAVGEFIRPIPTAARFAYGFDLWKLDQAHVLNMHVSSDLELPAPPSATRIHWEYGILDSAYANPDAATDGVEFVIDGVTPDGDRRELFSRILIPAARTEDRGAQTLDLPFAPRPGERLFFRTRDNGSPSFDWAYFRRIAVE